MRSIYSDYVIWHHFVPEPSTSFSQVPLINVVTTLSNVTDVTVWPITSNPNPRILKKYKIIEMKMKMKKEIKLN